MEQVSERGVGASGRFISVVAIDSHPIVLDSVKRLLCDSPYMRLIGDATDGVDGLERIRQMQPDVVIIDINLTRLDGLELVRRVRAQHAIGIVVTSGGNSIEDSRLAFHAGANAYVNKSAPISVLNAALILAGNGYVGFPSRSISITFSKRKVGASGKLTARELRVQQLLAEGCRNVEVAQRLGVSPKTVATFKNRILKKMSGEG